MVKEDSLIPGINEARERFNTMRDIDAANEYRNRIV
jgi:hypothetical protein